MLHFTFKYAMFVIPDFMNIFQDNYKNNYNLNSLVDFISEYKMSIKEFRSAHEKVGLICQNILTTSLFENEIDFLIFPASVLESQVHREYASVFQNKVILEVKNEENLKHAKDFSHCASVAHQFIGVDHRGNVCKRASKGNDNIGLLIFDLNYLEYDFRSGCKNLYRRAEAIEVDDRDGFCIVEINQEKIVK